MARLLIIRGESHLRNTSEDEILASLTHDELSLPRAIFDLNTTAFAAAIDSGYWISLDHHVQEFASRILVQANSNEHGTLFYFGVEETPALIALGAYLGDEYRIECRDYDRDAGAFVWPNDAEPVSFEKVGIPEETVDAAGDVVLIIELSYPVNPADVADVVSPSERLATISIRPANGGQTVGLLRSQGDVDSFRLAFRETLAAIDRARPNARVIHLFLAGSVSACIAAGQELRLRNGRRVQTYRYRAKDTPQCAKRSC